MPKDVYAFAQGHKDLKGPAGREGANLAEMTTMGLPVQPGFTITDVPGDLSELRQQLDEELRVLTATT